MVGGPDDVISFPFLGPLEEEEEEEEEGGITDADADTDTEAVGSWVGTPEKSPPYPRTPPILSFDFCATGIEETCTLALGVVTKVAKARTTSSLVLTDPTPISLSLIFSWFWVRDSISKGVEERGTLIAETAEGDDDNREEEVVEEEETGSTLLLMFFNFGTCASTSPILFPILSILSIFWRASISTSKSSSKSKSELWLLLCERDWSDFNFEFIRSVGTLKTEGSGSEDAVCSSPKGPADSSNFRLVPDWGPPWIPVLYGAPHPPS
jgi:hypothetical protein